ncbi:MAG: peptidylprolyl isomerase [Anaerolineae bacterium]|nr:peptidylprolyl isomerase [Anaerolineae bacterium]
MPRYRRWTAGWVIGLALVLLLAAIPGYAQDHSQDTDPVVSRVNGDPILRTALHGRVRFVRWQYVRELEKLHELTGGNFALTPGHVGDLLASLDDPALLGDAVLTQLEEERLLWQTGESIGVTPTAEDAQAYETAFFSLWTGVPADQVAGNADAQVFIADWYASATAASGLSANDIRIVFETEALRDKLFEHLGASVPTEELAVNTRHILCSFHPDNVGDLTPPSAEQRAAAAACLQDAANRLDAGEPFADVAAALSDDRASASQGGEVGWQLVSYLVTAYADAVRDAPLNTRIGPVETEFGFHLIEVLGRDMQSLTADQLNESQQGYFQLWLADVWTGATVERAPDWNAALPADPGLESLSGTVLAALDEFRARE